MSDMTEKALKLYYEGKTEVYICKKTCISLKRLRECIKSDLKRKALNLYLLGETKTRVCKKLNIYMSELNKWINDISYKKSTQENLQNGKSSWVSSIIKNCK
jgi:hypothetical protein